jgi:hypothetical protein
MSKKPSLLLKQNCLFTPEQPVILVGKIIKITEDGVPFVKFEGSPNAGVIAKVGVPAHEFGPIDQIINLSVLILLQDNDPQKAIITGVIRDKLFDESAVLNSISHENTTQSLTINGKSLLLEGENEIVLRCGLGSITLRANGQITLKGTKLLSRASESNKVRGASVFIN